MPDESWKIPDATTLDVWIMDLHPSDEITRRLQKITDASESARAQQLKNPIDQQRFLTAHASLRVILGAYLNYPPDVLKFIANPFGKPSIATPSAAIAFNLSRSGGLALLAVSNGRDIGIDLERRRPIEDWPGIAQQFFTRREVEALQQTPAENRDDAFLTFWTLKEAYVKAVGKGLSLPLNSFDVSAFLTRPINAWRAYTLNTPPSHVAAAVTSGPTSTIRMQRLILSPSGSDGITPSAM